MRRVLSIGIIVLVAAAFTVAVLTEGNGPAFLVALVAVAGMMVGLVFLVAFSGGPEARLGARFQDGQAFAELEDAIAERRSPQELGDHDLSGFGTPPAGGAWVSAQAFVATLVPVPPTPVGPAGAAHRHERLAGLRTEGAGLIRLAKAADVDLAPYEAYLTDARRAARHGDTAATLRSLQLANELLRATVERTVAKRTGARTERPPTGRP